MIGWNTIYLGFEWLLVPFVFVCDLGAQAAYRDVFWTACLWGGQLADREEGSDEFHHLCYGPTSFTDATFKLKSLSSRSRAPPFWAPMVPRCASCFQKVSCVDKQLNYEACPVISAGNRGKQLQDD